ncbi:MAG: adenosylcobinamide-phosphate synthase CbiB [Ilumatobacteraceae bacterium]
MNRSAAVGVGLAADLVFGEIPVNPHPVAAFGTAMTALEKHCYRDSRVAGTLFTLCGVSVSGVVGLLVRSTWFATFIAAAPKGLFSAAQNVHMALENGDLPAARKNLRSLVGRNPDDLDEQEISRAAIESVAENMVDAVVATAFWGAIAGAPGICIHRAINTLDAMVGHHDSRYEKFGWASARLDDILAYVPARLTALIVLLLRPSRRREIWRAVRHDAPNHPSPNAGVAEAAFAGALDLQLGGTNVYGNEVERRPLLGTGKSPNRTDIVRAIQLARHVCLAVCGLCVSLTVLGRLGSRRMRKRSR